MNHSKGAPGRGMSVLLLSRSLEVGGAERQLIDLAKGLKSRGHRVTIALFYRRGPLVEEAQSAGLEIVDLNKKSRWDSIGFLIRAALAFRRIDPDIVFTILGGANVVGAAVKPFGGRSKLVWTVLNSEFDESLDNWLAKAGHGLETALGNWPDAIVCNAAAGRRFAIARGFPADRIEVIPNGIDTDRFRPDERIRLEQRAKWGLATDQVAVGVLARLNATKGYPTFLRAAARVAETDSEVRFFAIGGGEDREGLHRLAGELGIADRVTFTGEADPVAALNALDIACSTSNAEGFSNAIAEAMACGLPCIVTDVGDSAAIVGDAGVVVPPSSPEALAKAISDQVRNLDGHDPAKPRRRILDNFSMNAMVERTLAVFRSVLAA